MRPKSAIVSWWKIPTDAIVSVDEKMRVVQWNRAASTLFGFTRDMMMGNPVDILIPEKFKQQHREGCQPFLETGEATFVGKAAELEGLRKDGTTVPIEISLSATERGCPHHHRHYPGNNGT